MSGNPIELRIRHPKGSNIISNLYEKSCIFDLKNEISKTTSIPISKVSLKFGYPPQRMDLPDNTTLENVGLISGETIIVEESQGQSQVYSTNPVQHSKPTTTNQTQHTTISTGPRTTQQVSTKPSQIVNPDGLIMIRRVIAADNSCLFNSIAYALENKAKNKAKDLRNIVAAHIMSDPDKYSEVVLERKPKDYIQWIQKDESWGGAIELEIFSKYYEVEIAAVDVENVIITVFGTGENYKQRIYVLYDGIHYDIIVRNISEDMDISMDITVFDPNDKYAYEGALVVARELNAKKQFTNTHKFTIQCGVCYERFKGEKEAMEHNSKTGHINFQEVPSQ